MGDTKIEWTHAPGYKGVTWNPTRGCSLTSDGCRNCYAMKLAHRFSGPGGAYEGLTRLGNHGPVWTGGIRLVPEKLIDPLKWRKPRMVFVNSMSDLFHEGLTDEEIAAVFGVMASCPQHRFLVLTKRPERMKKWFEWVLRDGKNDCRDGSDEVITTMFGVAELNAYMTRNERDDDDRGEYDHLIEDPPTWPLSNVWLGVSVENQTSADARIPLLLQTPAVVRFISAEPLLCPINFSRSCFTPTQCKPPDQVIVGGESGHGARHMDPDWARQIRDDCKKAGVAFFFKQMTAKAPIPDDLMIREWPNGETK